MIILGSEPVKRLGISYSFPSEDSLLNLIKTIEIIVSIQIKEIIYFEPGYTIRCCTMFGVIPFQGFSDCKKVEVIQCSGMYRFSLK